MILIRDAAERKKKLSAARVKVSLLGEKKVYGEYVFINVTL